MNIPRVLLIAFIAAVALAGWTDLCTAQDTRGAENKDPEIDKPPKTNKGDKLPRKGEGEGEKPVKGSGITPTQSAGSGEDTGNPLFSWHILLLIGAMMLMFLFMGRGRRKTEAKRRTMLAALKKGDKVTSIGGIVGTIIEIREDEIAVKVDEGNNIRMRFARWAIRGVGEKAKDENASDK